jgi:hypothetical protein
LIRLLADENVPLASIRRIRDAGWDVAEVVRGATDLSGWADALAQQLAHVDISEGHAIRTRIHELHLPVAATRAG